MCTGSWRRLVAVACLGVLIEAAALAQPGPPPVPDELRRLASMKSVCVDTVAGEAGLAATVREMVFAGLFAGRAFTVTERCDRADAVVKGAILERATSKVRAEGEGTNFGAAAGGAARDGAVAAAAVAALAGGQSETLYSSEQGQAVSVVLRIVDSDGVVLWAHAQESPGGKQRGATADAVDRSLKQLARDLARAKAP